jgi:hypothetical protein
MRELKSSVWALCVAAGVVCFVARDAAGQGLKLSDANPSGTNLSGPNSSGQAAIPGGRALMLEVVEHQKKLEKIRENYTYRSVFTDDEVDSKGQVQKSETEEREVFFVNTHRIERTVKKGGKPLNDHDQQKEQERVNKLVEKAQKTPPGEPLDSRETVSITHLLDIMEVSNPRREVFRGRSTLVFDFAGRHDAKTHGLAEDASKKLAGTVWVDERDRQVAHLEARFTDNFHVGGGLLANVQKGSSFYFDQAPVNGEIWFPTGAEGRVEARVLLLKGIREHFVEKDSDYQRFTVDTETSKTATIVPDARK